MVDIIIKKIAEGIKDKIEASYVTESSRHSNNRFFIFTPYITTFIIWAFHNRFYEYIYDIMIKMVPYRQSNILELTIHALADVIAFIIEIVGSVFIVTKITRWIFSLFPSLWEKISAFENVNGIYYLKKEKIYLRGVYKFSSKWIDVIIVLLSFVFRRLYDVGWIWKTLGDLELSSALLGVGVFLNYSHIYLNSKTYEETIKSKERGNRELQCRETAALNEAMGNSLELYRILFDRYAEEQAEGEMDFQEQYKELFDSLMNEKNVFVTNIFYWNWGIAVLIPIHKILLENRRVIIIVGASIDADNVEDWLREGLRSMIGTKENWRVRIWDEMESEWDIAVLPYTRIPVFLAWVRCHAYAAGTFLLVMEPSRILLEMQQELECLAMELQKQERPPLYCFADRNMNGLLDTLSHIFKCSIININILTKRCQRAHVSIIDEEGGGEERDYWRVKESLGGAAMVLYELFSRLDGDVEYISGLTVPLYDMKLWLREVIANNCKEEQDRKRQMKSFEAAEWRSGIWGIQKKQRNHIVVRDEFHHFGELFQNLVSQVEEEAHIYILEEHYLLKDFMLERSENLFYSKQAIPVYYPIYQESERNLLYRLMLHMYRESVDEDEIKKCLPNIFQQQENCAGLSRRQRICAALERLGKKYLETDRRDSDSIFLCRPDGSFTAAGWSYEENRGVFEKVWFLDEEREEKILGCWLKGQVNQYYLPGQKISLEGKYYSFERQERKNNREIVWLKRYSGFVQNYAKCHQRRNYSVSVDNCIYGVIKRDKRVKLRRVAARKVVVETSGFYEINEREGEIVRIHGSQLHADTRRYKNKDILLVSFCTENANNQDSMEKNCFYLCMLLAEVVKIVYPYHHQYLAFLPINSHDTVCSGRSEEAVGAQPEKSRHPLEEEMKLYRKCRYTGKIDIKGWRGSGICVIEDCWQDLGLIESVMEHFEELLEICYEYTSWISKRQGEQMSNRDEVVEEPDESGDR